MSIGQICKAMQSPTTSGPSLLQVLNKAPVPWANSRTKGGVVDDHLMFPAPNICHFA